MTGLIVYTDQGTCMRTPVTVTPTPRPSASLVTRQPRGKGARVMVHSGPIASGDQVIKDAQTRDDLAKKLDALCFDMELSQNNQWHGYAAMTAAVRATEFLKTIPIADVSKSGLKITEEELQRFVEAAVSKVKGDLVGSITMADQQAAISKINDTLVDVDQRFLLLDQLAVSVKCSMSDTTITAGRLKKLELARSELQAALEHLAESVLRQKDESSP
ncbi:hypothetical protein ETB97_011930 [Aspergillus alliaceus]|uniref:Uncharacterized protein n=1 Tax=Petromyces alliaceus TaxID=209559 RepID=A0A8H6A807_PETAA|nr:hypothetical protein ETB97_011930 [Aspergillus burnettii]